MVKLKADLAAFLGSNSLSRTEITKKLWDYIKANKLQTKSINGKPENAGKYIVADAKLIKIFNNTKTTSKTGKLTDFTKLKEGQTIDMMQLASVVSANIEQTKAIDQTFCSLQCKVKNCFLEAHPARIFIERFTTVH